MRKRDVEILTTILQDRSKGVSLSRLAQKYNVTERTLRNDLHMINDYLKSLKMPEIRILSDGALEFEGEIDEQRLLGHLRNLDIYDYHMQMNERADIILVILITRDNYITAEELAEKLFVSRSSVIKDLNRLKGICRDRGLEIQSVLGQGILIRANETVYRKELFRIITDNVTLEAHRGGTFQHILLKELQFEIPLQKMESLVRQNEKKRHLQLSDEGYVRFACYLFVVANRVKNGHYLIEEYEAAEEAGEDIAVEIFRDIMHSLELPVPAAECRKLKEEVKDWSLILKNGFSTDYMLLENCVAEFIHALSRGLQTDYFDDRGLFDFTIYFVEEIRERGNAEPKENALRLQIIEKYADEYRVVKESSEIFERSLGLTLQSGDIANLTMHVVAAGERMNHFKNVLQILIVCPGNMATGQFLQAQIRRHFSYKIKAVCSVRSLYDEDQLTDVDMIISTVPVWNVSCPLAVVNPLLRLEDIQRIQEVAFQILSKKDFKQHGENTFWNVADRIWQLVQQEKNPALKDHMISELKDLERKFNEMKARTCSRLWELLSPDTIEITDRCDTWQNALRRAGRMLVRKGRITSDYIDACIRSCEINGPYFVLNDGLAIAHAHPEDGMIEPGASLLLIREEVSFEHEAYGPVKLLFFICLKEANNELLKFLIDCAKNKELIAKIENQADSKRVYEILSDYEMESEVKEKSYDE